MAAQRAWQAAVHVTHQGLEGLKQAWRGTVYYVVHWDEAVVLGLDYLTGGISTDLLTSQQFGAALDAADQFVAGFSDAMTAGMSTRAREALWGELATRNHEGAWFTAGSAAGTAYSTGLAFVSPCGAPKLAALGLRAINGVQFAGNVTNAYENFRDGNYVRGGLDTLAALGNVSTLLKACFAAGTPLLTPTGHKAIETFRPGDWVLAAPEGDPAGAVEAKRVEEVFVPLGRLLHLHVGGQVIRTTAEHPFWVRGKGCTPAEEVAVGDELRSHDGRWVPVEDWCDTGEVAPVYNLRVADYHTYFVGSREWTFSVWAHNAYAVRSGTAPSTPAWGSATTVAGRTRTQGVLQWTKGGKTHYVDGLTSGWRNAASKVPGIRAIVNPAKVRNWHHVETQAAIIMRQQNIRHAMLTINNPNGICQKCLDNLAYRLQKGTTLAIYDVSGSLLEEVVGRGVLRNL